MLHDNTIRIDDLLMPGRTNLTGINVAAWFDRSNMHDRVLSAFADVPLFSSTLFLHGTLASYTRYAEAVRVLDGLNRRTAVGLPITVSEYLSSNRHFKPLESLSVYALILLSSLMDRTNAAERDAFFNIWTQAINIHQGTPAWDLDTRLTDADIRIRAATVRLMLENHVPAENVSHAAQSKLGTKVSTMSDIICLYFGNRLPDPQLDLFFSLEMNTILASWCTSIIETPQGNRAPLNLDWNHHGLNV